MRGDDGGELSMSEGFGTWEVEGEGLSGKGWEEVVKGLSNVAELKSGGREDAWKSQGGGSKDRSWRRKSVEL